MGTEHGVLNNGWEPKGNSGEGIFTKNYGEELTLGGSEQKTFGKKVLEDCDPSSGLIRHLGLGLDKKGLCTTGCLDQRQLFGTTRPKFGDHFPMSRGNRHFPIGNGKWGILKWGPGGHNILFTCEAPTRVALWVTLCGLKPQTGSRKGYYWGYPHGKGFSVDNCTHPG